MFNPTMFLFFNENKNRYRFNQIVDEASLLQSKTELESMVRMKATRALADAIVTDKMEEVKGKFTTRFEIDLLVFTPDQFTETVQRLATDYAMRMRPPMSPKLCTCNSNG